jgi:DNA helicase-2/ATP-dependent DNA helicase PcrA
LKRKVKRKKATSVDSPETSPGFVSSKMRQTLLGSSGHLLVLGGPGSGKTTIGLLKADNFVDGGLRKGQLVLFLSFARATVTRIAQQAKGIMSAASQRSIEISTYHGFAWGLLRSYGYLLNNKRKIRLIAPPEAASRLAEHGDATRDGEKHRLFAEEGLLHFDLFAPFAAELLERSQSLSKMFCSSYPLIIFDEFQDTNADEWRLVQALGKYSTIIALADVEQRIYEFRGADPARVGQFIEKYNPTQFDFGTENNRSNGTDIVQFGNDLIAGRNKRKTYEDVIIKRYPLATGNWVYLPIKTEVLAAIKRVKEKKPLDWSIAILVPSNKLMLVVSDFLNSTQRTTSSQFPAISHDVALEMAGPSLAGIIIASLMERGSSEHEIAVSLLYNLCDHLRGRSGGEAPKTNLDLSAALRGYAATGKVRGSTRQRIVNECFEIAARVYKIRFTGNPIDDWVSVRKMFEECDEEHLKQVGIDASYLRLLRRGAVLGSGLSTLWKTQLSYLGAGGLVRSALAQEHFATATTAWRGVHVMTIHKAKGKEFDEVIVFEGPFWGKFVRTGSTPKDIGQSRLTLRVAVTRARKLATIFTPERDACQLL